jgi:hypothetical protein
MSTISVSFTTTDGVSYPCSSATYNPLTYIAPSSGNWYYYLISYDASNPTINIHIDMSGSSGYVLNFCLMGSGGLGGVTLDSGGGGGGTGELSLAQFTYTYSSNVIIQYTLADIGSKLNCYISNTNNQVIFAAGHGIDGWTGNVGKYEISGADGGAGGTGGGLNGTINNITCSTIQGGGGYGGTGSSADNGSNGATNGGASVKFADGQSYTFYGGIGGAPATDTTSKTDGMAAKQAFMMLYYHQ